MYHASLAESARLEVQEKEFHHFTQQLQILLVRKAKRFRVLEEVDLFSLPAAEAKKNTIQKQLLQNELQTLLNAGNYTKELYQNYLEALIIIDSLIEQNQQLHTLSTYYYYQFNCEHTLHMQAIDSMELLSNKLTELLNTKNIL